MAVITRFEDIEAWKKARELTNEVYRVTNEGAFAKDFGLRDQIRRAAVSVMSNIAEGFERRGDKEFSRFLCPSFQFPVPSLERFEGGRLGTDDRGFQCM